MNQPSYRQALRARWFVIVATAAVVTCLAAIAPPAAVSYSQLSTALKDLASPAHAKYQATAAIGVPPTNSGGDASPQFKAIQFYVQSTGVGDAFAKRLHYTGGDYAMLSHLIVLESDPKSGIMTVKGYGGTRAQAAGITNSFTDSLRDYLSALGTQITETSLQQAQTSVDDLKKRIADLTSRIAALRSHVTTAAQASDSPEVTQLQAEHDALVQSYTAAYQQLANVSSAGLGPRVSTAGLVVLQPARAATAKKYGPGLLYELWLRVLLGVIVGLALGAALALLLEHNARKIFSRDTAERAFGSRVLVEIPRTSRTGSSREVPVITAPGSRAASAYRMLRVILMSEPESARHRAIRPAAHSEAAVVRASSQGTEQQPSATFPLVPAGQGPSENGAGESRPEDDGTPQRGNGLAGPRGAALVVAATANEPTQAAVVANLAAAFVVSGETVTVLRIRPTASGAGGEADDVSSGPAPTIMETRVAGVRLVEWAPRYGGRSVVDVLAGLQDGGGVVLVDVGRVATAEFAEVAPLIDGVVAVCQFGRTRIDNASRTADIVEWSHVRLIGLVLTQVPSNAVERVTWRRWRRSPLSPGRGHSDHLSLGGRVEHEPNRTDDELGLLEPDGSSS